MSGTVLFNRMPRIQEPLPQGTVKLPAPPAHSGPATMSWLQMLLPLTGVLVMGGVYGGIRGDWRLAIPMLAISGVSAFTSVAGRLLQLRGHRQRARQAEAAYAAALEGKQAELESLRAEQQRIRSAIDPDLATLLARAQSRDPRLWERRPEDADFLSARLGIGELPSTVVVSAPHPDMPDPRLERAQALEATYRAVPGVPVTADLRAGPLGIAGPPPERAGVARAVICNLVAHHSPDEMHLLALCSPQRVAEWQWLKWLPHTGALDRPTPRHSLANDAQSAREVLKGLLEELHRRQNQLYGAQYGDQRPGWPWLVLLVEDDALGRDDPAVHLLLSPQARQLDATAIFLVDRIPRVPTGCGAVVEIQPDGRLVHSTAGTPGQAVSCQPELAAPPFCERLARCLAPLRVGTLQPDGILPTGVRLLEVMGVADVGDWDTVGAWRRRDPNHHLRVPIGVRRGNQPLILDLNHTGHGPHGLVAGTTGSGKSELLQTLVIALALTHHPYDVGFVLVDFKGGGAFAGLAGLPHTLGMVTDLSGNLTERALVALQAEMDRRKRLFNDAGVNDIGLYQQRYWQGTVTEPLPRLVVIIDEFAELVSDAPDFIDGLIAVARVGRSLGLHLILATQSPAGVVKQQIWANAKFRICLRVESRQESVEMLHRPEAASLDRIPGRGYLQVGNNDVFELFQVARVAGRRPGPAGSGASPADSGARVVIAEVSHLGQRALLGDEEDFHQTRQPHPDGPTDIDLMVQGLARTAEQMGIGKLPSPWPDPLPDRVALPDLLRRAGVAEWDGVRWPGAAEAGAGCPWLGAFLGLLDNPANQRQEPLLLELDRQDGHLIVVGAPGSGKKMLARSLVVSLARTHAPDQVHFYLLEFGGQPLQAFASLPHSGGVFTPLDGERVPRLFRRLLDWLEERKRACSAAGVDGLTRLRETRPGESPPAIVLIVTGFLEFRTVFPDEMLPLTRLVREGGPYGIHVVLMADRAADIPAAIASVVSRRIAMRLADVTDYSFVLGMTPRLSREHRFPAGRGWTGRPPLEFQAASSGPEEDETAQIAGLLLAVQQMDRCWQGARPEPIVDLPDRIDLTQVLSLVPRPAAAASPSRLAVPVGVDVARLQPAVVDLVRDGPDFIVTGTPQSGKTALLVAWGLALAEFHSPQQVQLVLVAGRRNSLGRLVGLPHVLEFCRTPQSFWEDGGLSRLRAEVERREALPGEVASWPDGLPRLLLVLDDYDEVIAAEGATAQALTELAGLVRRGRDTGMHTVVAGPLPNAGAGYNDPVIKQLKVGRSGFILRVLDPGDQNPLGVRIRSTESGRIPPGRGYVVRNGIEEAFQAAAPGDGPAVAAWVAALQERWRNAGAVTASWPDLSRKKVREKEDGDG